jgi:hypothetical protein
MRDDAAQCSVNAPVDEKAETTIAEEFHSSRIIGAAGLRFGGSIDELRGCNSS